MKKDVLSKSLDGSISLIISSSDPVAWKFMMLFEAASVKGVKIEDTASRYGYTREHFYVIKHAYEHTASVCWWGGLLDCMPFLFFVQFFLFFFR